jgi:hypothetical protein
MLANLAAGPLDEKVASIASEFALRYTRYADDICLSSTDAAFGRRRASQVIALAYRAMSEVGFSPNISKTHVVPPGGRKVVLGLLVDSSEPRLTRETRDTLRQHAHFLTHPNVGPALHAARRGFASTIGLRNHVAGLLSFAYSIDPSYAKKIDEKLATVQWPL